jgi:hypothetical protein
LFVLGCAQHRRGTHAPPCLLPVSPTSGCPPPLALPVCRQWLRRCSGHLVAPLLVFMPVDNLTILTQLRPPPSRDMTAPYRHVAPSATASDHCSAPLSCNPSSSVKIQNRRGLHDQKTSCSCLVRNGGCIISRSCTSSSTIHG